MSINTDKVKSWTDLGYKWIAIVGVLCAVALGVYNHFATRAALEEKEKRSMERDLLLMDHQVSRSEEVRYAYEEKQDSGRELTEEDKRRVRLAKRALDQLYQDKVILEEELKDQEKVVETLK